MIQSIVARCHVFWQNEAKFINKIKLDRILIEQRCAASLGAAGYLTKPIDRERLTRRDARVPGQ
jgi:hypothetical protein